MRRHACRPAGQRRPGVRCELRCTGLDRGAFDQRDGLSDHDEARDPGLRVWNEGRTGLTGNAGAVMTPAAHAGGRLRAEAAARLRDAHGGGGEGVLALLEAGADGLVGGASCGGVAVGRCVSVSVARGEPQISQMGTDYVMSVERVRCVERGQSRLIIVVRMTVP